MKREDLAWAATCAILAFAAVVIGAGRGWSTAWPWLIFGAAVGALISLMLRRGR